MWILLLTSAPIHAIEILVLGDSWARPIGTSLRNILVEKGYPRSVLHTTAGWGLACTMADQDGLDMISHHLSLFPETDTVHLSIGANDILNNWNPAMAGTQAETDLLDSIVDCVDAVVDHIVSIDPRIHVVWSSYDFLRPTIFGTPAELNAILIKLAQVEEAYAANKGPLVSFIDIIGTMQVTFGFDGLKHSSYDPDYPIPPGHPSLPDEMLPSPAEAFPDWDSTHPLRIGYDAMALAQYENFYKSLPDSTEFNISPGLNDAWYSPDTAGQGFLVSVFPDLGQMFVAWFTFDMERPPENVPAQIGDPGHRWLTAQGPYSGDTAELEVYLTEGGVFDSGDPPASTNPDIYGSMTVQFADCEEGLVRYEIDSPGVSGEIPIQRITMDNVPLCETLSSATEDQR
jgi:hypothetical protein